ncbi:Vps5 C terminal like-domain-containing protein [Lipomyces oligophaga]|uniref:Vps5 C terminal like-domain-containing protein n=1 Tax=Lipomyces oligophaga TaxID=45792 RepID=UPI0034CDB445
MDPDELGAAQWDDVASSLKPVTASPIDENPFGEPAKDDIFGRPDTDEVISNEPDSGEAEPEGPAESGEATDQQSTVKSEPAKKPELHPLTKVVAELSGRDLEAEQSRKEESSSSYTAGPASASRARAARKARSKKSTTQLAGSDDEADEIDPTLNPLGPVIDDSASTVTEGATEQTVTATPGSAGLPPELANERGIQSAMESAAAAAAVAADPSLAYIPTIATTDYADSAPASSSTAIPRHIAVEQPLKAAFEIQVGDPIKVGELTSAHTVFNVRTRTTSNSYRFPDFTVTRRYRDFRWLYHQLSNNNPGIIIPAPPEKQSMGRFDESFVEGRRAALEKMLTKITEHPVLQNDPDLRLFLESDSLNSDIKLKEKLNGQTNEKLGLFGSLALSGKFVETDEWFVDKKQYVEALDIQLRSLARALDTVIIQRKELADTTAEFAAALSTLAEVELSRPLSSAIAGLAEIEQRARDLHERQGLQDMLTLGDTIDEYVRLVESIKAVFVQRQKSYVSWQNAEVELSKKQQTVSRAYRSGKTAPERLTLLQEETSEFERKVYSHRIAYDDVCKTIKVEFDKFQREKIEDFRSSVETYLESAVESQKEAIEMWETFYELQGFGQQQHVESAERAQTVQ